MKNHYFLGSLLLAGGLAFSATAQDQIFLDVADYYGDNHCGIEAKGSTDKSGNLNPLESLTFEDVEFTFDKGEGSSEPALYIKPDGATDLRVYAANSMTIKAPEGRKLYSITFDMTQGWYQYGEVQASTGTMLCNAGETDVKVEDKYDALPYVWTASDILGVDEVTISMTNDTKNEKGQPNRTFDGTKPVQFRFTAADITLAPEELALDYLFMEEGFDPLPNFFGETINLEETPSGMGVLGMATYVKLEKNMDCKDYIIIYHDDEPMSMISVANDPATDATQLPGCSVMYFSFGMEENTSLMQTTAIMLVLSEDPITSPGYYTVEIPDGFFTCGGVPVAGTGLVYEIAGGTGDLIDEGPLTERINGSEPPMNSVFKQEGEYFSGVALLMFNVESEGLPMDINTECEEHVTLTDADGNVLASVDPAYDPFDPDAPDGFQPICMIFPYGLAGEENMSSVMLQLFEGSDDAPGAGTYFLNVPAGFFVITDEEGAQYTFSNTTVAYRIIEGDVAGSFNEFVYDASPLPDDEVNLADDYWSDGLDSFQFYLNAFNGFKKNEECEEPVRVMRDGEVIHEILPDDTTNPGTVDVYPGRAGEEVENIITGETEKVIKPWLIYVSIYGDDYKGETTVGDYSLYIPDNYFKIGDFTVKGAKYEYKVVDSETAVNAFKADGTVTVYNMKGMRLLDNAPAAALRNLEKGFYIINGKKVIMK